MKMNSLNHIVVVLLAAFVWPWAAAGASKAVDTVTVKSPSGQVAGSFFVKDGQLHYKVEFKGEEVIAPSPLGITINGHDLGRDVQVRGAASQLVDETYTTRGPHTAARNHYREQTLEVSHKKTRYLLQVRAYDDGLAYRYRVKGESRHHVTAEASSWTLPARSHVWFFERESDWKLKTYAGEWRRTSAASLPGVSPTGPIQGPPLVVELPEQQGYAVLTEAALYDYSGLRLEAVGHNRVQANFTEGQAGFVVNGEVDTPWRVTLLASDLNSLVNSNLITNLNPAPDPKLFADTGYIKPGRATWRWWSRETGSPAQEKQFVDYAQALGFEYSLVDDGWEKWEKPWRNLERLCAYAAQRQVGIFVWKDWNQVRDPADDWRQMRVFLDSVKTAGAVGVKLDFMNAESKDRIDFEVAALRLAARRQLMVVFHGNHKPTGEARTYPNEISREGIRGLELNRMNEPLPASHNAALPFTRFVVGHGDYTPLGYSSPGGTTYAHQLATVVLFTSPLQVIAEHPAMLLHDESVAPGLEMLKAIPAVWDETRVLEPSRIGELAVMARRSGREWFLAALNGTDKPVTLAELDLSFLGEGTYTGSAVYSPSAKSLEQASLARVTGKKKHGITLAPADGYLVRFTPVK